MRSTVLLDLAGAFSAAAWASLAAASWGRAQVHLGLFLGVMAAAWAALLLVYGRLRVAPDLPPGTWRRILAWAILFRTIGLAGEPVLEDDFYRYLWDGRTFAAGGSPYSSRPLDHFGDASLPPRFQEILGQINYPDLPTIYGPVCQYVFLLGYWVAPGRLFPVKLILVLAELTALFLLRSKTRSAGLLLYAWCPLLVKEVAFTAHPEPLGIAFALAALLGAGSRPVLSGLSLALALGARLLAAPLVPVVLIRSGWKGTAAFAVALAALYAPFVIQGGGETGGLFPFAGDWEFNSFAFGLAAAGLGPAPARWLCAGVFAAFYALYLMRSRPWRQGDVPRGDVIYGLLFIFSPVVNPWYVLWLLPFVALRPSCWALAALAAVTLSYVHGAYLAAPGLEAYEHPPWVRPIELGMVVVALAVDLRTKRRTNW